MSQETLNYLEIQELSKDLASITQNGLITGFVAANEDGSNLEEADYTALPESKNTDGKIYIVFPNS